MDTLTGKTLLILGLARQGKALARFAAGVGAKVIVSDLRTADRLQTVLDELSDLEIEYVLGEHPMSLLDKADTLAISGSVPADAPFVEAAREKGVEVTNDSQEFARRAPTAVIGITGSAGKTTTTALTGIMGQLAGRRTWVGGNIGRPLIADLHKMSVGDMVVQELSSFQLEIWDQSPRVAAVLNITPNHLDRHKTMRAYKKAKANILRHQSEQDIAVLCADDKGSMSLESVVQGRLRLFSMEDAVADGAFVRDGRIWLRDGLGTESIVCDLSEIQLRGEHNILNVLAAITLADSVNIPIEAMVQAIRTFHGVEHRLELVRVVDDVQYINDSIATAPERAIAALNSFNEPLILLAGGKDKDMEWENWAELVLRRVKHVILFGDLAELLEEKLRRQPCLPGLDEYLTQVSRVQTMAQAVAVGKITAVSGDIVLLSPGGTSFDAFNDFAERGEVFRELVNQISNQ
jgi:UDP-N-acetylmuramoylalanine--D-glutamate ligase